MTSTLSLSHTNMHTHMPHAQMEDCDIQVLMWWTIVRGCWYDGWQFSVCFLLLCNVFFAWKWIKMIFFFSFDISTWKPSKNTKKSINLMLFQAKCTIKTHLITVWNAKTNNLLNRCWIAHRLCNQTESPYERSLQLSW